jgi:hypothetical protein
MSDIFTTDPMPVARLYATQELARVADDELRRNPSSEQLELPATYSIRAEDFHGPMRVYKSIVTFPLTGAVANSEYSRDRWPILPVTPLPEPVGEREWKTLNEFLDEQWIETTPDTPQHLMERAYKDDWLQREIAPSRYLGPDWQTEDIASLVAKSSAGMVLNSVHGAVPPRRRVLEFLLDLERVLLQIHPELSRAAAGMFWRSWQVHEILARFCRKTCELDGSDHRIWEDARYTAAQTIYKYVQQINPFPSSGLVDVDGPHPAQRIREFLRKEGLSIEALAKSAKVSKNTIRRIMDGEGVRSTSRVKIAKATGCRAEDLL